MSYDALKKMTEQELREYKVPWPETMDEVTEIVAALRDRTHDYGTSVYAMSIAATAMFYYMSSCVGATGFQASCADLDIIKRLRRLDCGFRLLNFANLLYPQCLNSEHFPTRFDLLNDPEIRTRLRDKALESLANSENVHPDVKARWEFIAGVTK